jgi:hypothetical protein
MVVAELKFGVDSKTKTDCDGAQAKHLERMRRFRAAARSAALPS